mmetsp:Transcript_20597/g.29811  ORF Transcript_20597/g.29811 Transcript_20597/m.29811 type:complete len:216 (-) Transcript_20597:127-774(-)|eukprot:CAMPEP_0113934920 /NCGR_PEP_ID=MMETSP1339-20121228/2171_1 /TAXON_ID=94617 /ORGANISM="Fibrocapsa japonica" /LENGTH=215 /DNA_ID=CAMNT_0000936893 /DNA_START=87 /DNA_END=737 /DNA_ORIENTATION=- /assembly_acc=CAM_ASM_000762
MDENEREHPRWDDIWRNEPIPKFDKGCPSPALEDLEEKGVVPKGRALVPGMGRGYDVTFLARPDREVFGLDIVEECIQAANERLDSLPDTEVCKMSVNFLKKSFFDLPTDEESDLFDFIYDYTFFCTLHPSLRGECARKMFNLLKPGGILCTIIYPIMPRDRGPPYEVSTDLYESVLLPEGFTVMKLEVLPDTLCHPGRGDGKSALGLWLKPYHG